MNEIKDFPHSLDYFVMSRDYWWNPDFLQLMAKRWDLQKIRHILDVGCGQGHWGRALNEFLPDDAVVLGIDREKIWLEKAADIARKHQLSDRYSYEIGNAESIQWSENSFDMVTCQTLLIHVDNVKLVLKEMIRVLKPGGLLVLIEPNNLCSSLVLNTLDVEENIDKILDAVKFQLHCEFGRKKLKEGFFSLGDLLPGYLTELELNNIQAYNTDKTWVMCPPYETEQQKSVIKDISAWADKEFWIWGKDDSKRYFEAGGGNSSKFEYYWNNYIKRYHQQFLTGIRNKTYASTGGRILYCISATKPK